MKIENMFEVFRTIMMAVLIINITFPIGALEYIITPILFIFKKLTGIEVDWHPKLMTIR